MWGGRPRSAPCARGVAFMIERSTFQSDGATDQGVHARAALPRVTILTRGLAGMLAIGAVALIGFSSGSSRGLKSRAVLCAQGGGIRALGFDGDGDVLLACGF